MRRREREEEEEKKDHRTTLDRCNEGENCFNENFPFVILRFFNLLLFTARERFTAPTFSLIEYLIRERGVKITRVIQLRTSL